MVFLKFSPYKQTPSCRRNTNHISAMKRQAMAVTKDLVFTMPLIAFAMLLLVESGQKVITTPVDNPLPVPREIDCGEACDARCQLSSRQKICKRACGTCCARCQCVPPGTSGNYDVCPCYANMTTHGGRHKCP